MRNAGAIDVGVHQADLAAGPAQPIGQIGGDRALADAALARADGDDGLGRQADLAQLFRLALVGRDFTLTRQMPANAARRCSASSVCVWPHNGAAQGRQPQDNRQPIVLQPQGVDLFELRDRRPVSGSLNSANAA